MKVTLNINDQVKVKLTSWGARLLCDYVDNLVAEMFETAVYTNRFLIGCRDLYKKDDDGSYKFTIWELSHIFGPHLFGGCDQIFENNELILCKEV